MALTNAEKQAWLILQGKPKSYMYFMTGPNLGPDWDWNKAVSGGYQSHELNGFFSSGEGAYKAHKTKGQNKSTANPGGPNAPGTNCAATASKNIIGWVAQSTKIANGWWTSIGSKVSIGGPITTNSKSFLKALKTQIDDAIEEVGQHSDEVATLIHLREMMQDVDRLADQAADGIKLADAWTGVTTPEKRAAAVESLARIQKRVDASDAVTYGDVDILFDDVFEEAADVFADIKNKVAAQLRQDQDIAIGRTWRKAAVDQGDDFNLIPGFQQTVLDGPIISATTEVRITVEAIGEITATGLREAVTIIESGKKLDTLSRIWQKQLLGDDYAERVFNVRQIAFDTAGDIGKEIKASVGNVMQAYSDLTDDYVSALWWQEGSTGTLAGSPVEFWYGTYGTQSTARIAGELEEIEKLLKALEASAVFPQHAATNLITNLAGTADEAIGTFNQVFEFVKYKLPGATKTHAEIIGALEPGYVSKIMASGTDELNPLVQAQLEATGEVKTLTYFMTKGEKQDFILLGETKEGIEAFKHKHYEIKWKGQVLEGDGLGVAKKKYAIKNGEAAPLSTAEVQAQVVGKVTDSVTGQVTTYTSPPGSPPWWTDKVSDAQIGFIENMADESVSFQVAWDGSHASQIFAEGKLTKGQASQFISQAKGGKATWTIEEIEDGLAYGVKVTGDDAVKIAAQTVDVDVSDITAAAKASEAGASSSSSSAAASSVNWDEPHTFTYVGDGSKWGGAHRKWHFTDESGSDWMLKHGDEFRGEGELAAHKIGHAAGFDVAEAKVVTQTVPGSGSQTGVIQKMYTRQEIRGELGDIMPGGSFVGVEDDIVRQVQEHQVLDWLIGNHDGHTQNFLVMKDGRVVGIDKGQAFKFLGRDELSATYTPSGNFGEVAYNRMWSEYVAGKIDLDLDTIAHVLTRIEAMSDIEFRAYVADYAVGRFAAGARAGSLGTTSAKSAGELVDLALARKNGIRNEFTAFYRTQAEARGVTWNPVWEGPIKVKAAKVVKQLDPTEIITKIDAEFVAALDRAGSAGKALYVAGDQVEKGQVLFDVVLDSQGREVLRVNAIVRADADKKLMTLLKSEGGDAMTTAKVPAAGGFLPTTPDQVQVANTYFMKSLSGAKTINHHISAGDFEFNQATLDDIREALSGFKLVKTQTKHIKNVDEISTVSINRKVDELVQTWGAGTDDLDAAIVEFYSEMAADAAKRKAVTIYEPHMQSIIDQGRAGTAAVKVANVPDFDAQVHFDKVKDSALLRARKRAGSAQVVEHIEQVEPDKVFTSMTARSNRTYQVKIGSGEADRKAVLISDGPREIPGQSSAFVGTTTDGVEVIYRQVNGNYATHQGWLEVVIPTDGKVTQATIEQAYDVISRRMGLDLRLAVVDDMELTYWRTLTGSYRNSREGVEQATKYYKAIELADQNVSALGVNPTTRQEIDAIKDAWRTHFGDLVDDADFLPIHDHALASHAEEIGFGYYERFELGDMYRELDGKIVTHNSRYGDGNVRAEMMHGGTGDALMSQDRRQRIGFSTAAGSAGRDIETGGASGFFTTLSGYSGARPNMVVMNPARVHRKMGTYNATGDTYGKLSARTSRSTLLPSSWSRYANSSNETMIRGGVSWMDDIEIAFFETKSEADKVLSLLKARGITSIRGVNIEARFVFHQRPQQYVKEFFDLHIGRQGFSARLRRTAAEVLEAASEKSKTLSADFGVVVSRLKTKTDAAFGRVMGKNLSAGRQAEVQLSDAQGYHRIALRYHNSENAVTLAMDQLETAGILTDQGGFAVGTLMDSLGVKNWSHTAEMRFKHMRREYTGNGITIDLSPYGVDLQHMSKYERPQVLREFVQHLTSGTMDDFIAKWGTVGVV